jgi:NAD(P)-dependent dehydrogenase (short-subunit alcohol dehydrogenase family)
MAIWLVHHRRRERTGSRLAASAQRTPIDYEEIMIVLVTGGTRGLGLGLSQAFLDAGHEVVVCGRSEAGTPATATGGDRVATFVAADVRDPDQVEALVRAVVDRHGRLDVLINNAGGSPPADSATVSPRFVAAIITLNLVAPFVVSQRANEVMQRQPEGGSIINISSLCGLRPSPGTAAYGAAKAGLINLTGSLAVEFAPKVRVNCVTAGALETDELHNAYGGDAYFEAVAATVPLGRMGRPPDVAKACLFLASDAASFITGANLVVHGGGDDPPPVAGDG